MAERVSVRLAADPPAETGGGAPDAEPVAQQAIDQAVQAVAGIQSDVEAAAAGKSPAAFDLPAFGAPVPNAKPKAIDLLGDVNLNVKIELGRTQMLVEDVLRLAEGAVVELDKLAGDPVDIYVNERPIARGEVLVLNDNFCIRINEILPANVEEAKKEAQRA